MCEREKFYCKKCKGVTYDVDYCDNPSCPNMPCCGKPKESCDCFNLEKPIYTHDCHVCKYLGSYDGYDLYFCKTEA